MCSWATVSFLKMIFSAPNKLLRALCGDVYENSVNATSFKPCRKIVKSELIFLDSVCPSLHMDV